MFGTRSQADPVRPSERMLTFAMVVATAIVLGLGVWASSTDMEAAIARVAEQQAFLAFIVAQDVSSRLALFEENERLSRLSGEPASSSGPTLLGSVLEHLRAVQRERQMLVLVRTLDHLGFTTADGRLIRSGALEAGFEERADHVVLSREEGLRLGMTRHRVIAGLATASAEGQGTPRLQIAVLASAAPERERVFRNQWRSALIGLIAIAVVLWLGRLAIHQQRTELDLAAKLSRSQLEGERDAQLARADRFAMLAAMSTGIAHELGTPLGVIVGRLEQLHAVASEDERAARSLRVIQEQAERMNGIIRGFLALARGETPVLEHTSPQSIAEQATALVHHRFLRANVQLESEVSSTLPNVALDARLFTQALVNLLINACEASAAGDRVSLRVRVEGPYVCFEVSDHGVGITADDAKRSTEPFFTTRAQQGGTGLGLAIATEISKQHGGSLDLAPNPPRGTVATIRLPAATTAG